MTHCYQYGKRYYFVRESQFASAGDVPNLHAGRGWIQNCQERSSLAVRGEVEEQIKAFGGWRPFGSVFSVPSNEINTDRNPDGQR
jgi:hypothetical protein